MKMNWKTLCDSILLVEGCLGTYWSLVYLVILIRKGLYKKSPLALLVGNTSLCGLCYHLVILNQSFHMLFGYSNVFCIVRGHLIHAFAGSVYHSICLQSLHRLFVTVYSNQMKYQNKLLLFLMIIVQWIFSLTFCLPTLNPYPKIDDICLGPFHRRYVFIHLSIAVYLIPILFLIVVYSKILFYIKQKTSNYILESLSTKHRLHREMSILRRIILPVVVMLITGLPLSVFFIQGQFTKQTPEYSVRIGIICLTVGTSISMLFNLIFTDSIRQHLSSSKYLLLPTALPKNRFFNLQQFESASCSFSNNQSKNHLLLHLIEMN